MSKVVIFRKSVDGGLIALFPNVPAGVDSSDTGCMGFSKHGRIYTDIGVVNTTKEAREEEYVSLLMDMVRAGAIKGDERIVKRVTPSINAERKVALLELKENIKFARVA